MKPLKTCLSVLILDHVAIILVRKQDDLANTKRNNANAIASIETVLVDTVLMNQEAPIERKQEG